MSHLMHKNFKLYIFQAIPSKPCQTNHVATQTILFYPTCAIPKGLTIQFSTEPRPPLKNSPFPTFRPMHQPKHKPHQILIPWPKQHASLLICDVLGPSQFTLPTKSSQYSFWPTKCPILQTLTLSRPLQDNHGIHLKSLNKHTLKCYPWTVPIGHIT